MLIGPQVGSTLGADGEVHYRGADDCHVTVVEGLFSRLLLLDQLGAVDPAIQPDVAMLHNADVYMPYWRRTLAELLQMQSKSSKHKYTCVESSHHALPCGFRSGGADSLLRV